MDSGRQPWSLKTIVSQRKYAYRNNLLHLIVLDNSKKKSTCSETFIRAVFHAFCSASVNSRNRHGYTALHLAVIRRNSFMVEKLLSFFPTINVNAECTNDLRRTALHLAASRQLAVVKNANTMALYGSSPHFNVQEEKVKIVKLLLSRGASAEDVDYEGCTPFSRAIQDQSVDFLKVLSRRVPLGERDMRRVASPLHRAVNKGCLADVRIYLNSFYPIDFKDLGGFTPLHFAILLTRVDMVDYFVSKGADVNARADCHSTPLHMVAENNGAQFRSAEHSRIAMILLEKGSKLNLENDRGETPLCVAARENLPDLVKLFVDAGANLNFQDLFGRTPLHAAVRENALEAIKVLIGCGALLDLKDANECSPFRLAVQGGLIDIVKILIDCKNIDLNAADDTGSTPLHEAVAGGYLSVVEALVESGAVVDATDSTGVTPLKMAKLQKEREIVDFLNSRATNSVVATLEELPVKKRKN